MTTTWHRCRTCKKAIQATLVATPTCPLCGDSSDRVDPNTVDKYETCLFVGPAPKPAEKSAFSATIAEMGRDAEWIQAATLAVSDGRISPSEARGLLLALRRHYAAARPLVDALADLAGEPPAPLLPTDLDDLDRVGDSDQIPPCDYPLPGRAICLAILAGLIGAIACVFGVAWYFSDVLQKWVW